MAVGNGRYNARSGPARGSECGPAHASIACTAFHNVRARYPSVPENHGPKKRKTPQGPQPGCRLVDVPGSRTTGAGLPSEMTAAERLWDAGRAEWLRPGWPWRNRYIGVRTASPLTTRRGRTRRYWGLGRDLMASWCSGDEHPAAAQVAPQTYCGGTLVHMQLLCCHRGAQGQRLRLGNCLPAAPHQEDPWAPLACHCCKYGASRAQE
jgi:hypothetical protein